jgi:hypothetical protein
LKSVKQKVKTEDIWPFIRNISALLVDFSEKQANTGRNIATFGHFMAT